MEIEFIRQAENNYRDFSHLAQMTIQGSAILRKEGNDLLNSRNVPAAIQKYSEAISVSPSDHLAFSNRSAAHIVANNPTRALDDAETCLQLAPKWAKSYVRKVNALRALGRFEEALACADLALTVLDDTEKEPIQSLKGQCQIDTVHKSLRGTWRGRVADEMGGYYQTMIFGQSNTVKIEVFGRHQNCTYSLDLSRSPALLTILFGPGGTTTTVPYIFELRDENRTLSMCCPFLTPDIPTEFGGPGLVTMKRWDGQVVEEESVRQQKAIIESVTDPHEKMRLYLEAFACVIADASFKIDASVPTALQTEDETDANNKVIQIMALHVKITELEEIFGQNTAKSAFGLISGGDDYFTSPEGVKRAAERLRDLLLSTGFITPEGLEQARLQYTRPKAPEAEKNSSKARLQKKLLEKRTVTNSPSIEANEPGANTSNERSIVDTTATEELSSNHEGFFESRKALLQSTSFHIGIIAVIVCICVIAKKSPNR
jgi:hypothetical protein